LNNLFIGTLDYGTYQISRLYTLWFLTRIFLRFYFKKTILVAKATRVPQEFNSFNIFGRASCKECACQVSLIWPSDIGGEVI
jgi:hypothetical protein